MSGYVYGASKAARHLKAVQDTDGQQSEAERLLELPGLFNHGEVSTRGGQCKRGCCWNPWSPGVCYYRRRCICHHPVSKLLDFIPDTLEEEAPADIEQEARAA